MAAAMRKLSSVEYSDDEKLDRMLGPEAEPPDYPSGLQFTIDKGDLAKITDGDAAPDMTLHFAAMGTAVGVYRDREDGARIEVELTELAGADGQFAPLDRPVAICLCDPELEKIDLSDECERGDTIHLIGSARVERTADPQWGGESVTLQIVELAVEDESEESRRG